MSDRYHIAMLWVEGPLSYVEQLCIQSFLDNGHDVTLYHYGEVTNVPDGTDMRHGREILDRDEFIAHGRTGSMALFSDVFRYHLLTKLDKTIWADTDAYCVRPFTSETGHFYGWESEHHINGGVLGLPKDSEALAGLLEMTKDEYGIPFWYGDRVRQNLQDKIDAGTPTHVSEMNWGVWGPHAVTAYVHKTGEDKYAFARDVLYPRLLGQPPRRPPRRGRLYPRALPKAQDRPARGPDPRQTGPGRSRRLTSRLDPYRVARPIRRHPIAFPTNPAGQISVSIAP